MMNDLEEFNDLAGTRPTVTPNAQRGLEVAEEPHSQEKKINAKMWAASGDIYTPCETAVEELMPAQYTVGQNHQIGIFLKRRNASLDGLIMLPDSESESVINGVNQFWEKEKHFREFGFLWKRGVLLWGPAGSGKTSTLQIVSKNIIDAGGISVYADDPKLTAIGLDYIRKIEPDRPVVVMIEDIDAIIEQYGEANLLALLDGELQIDNVVFIATTNYPEKLDKRLVNRPSRFDVIKKIGMPNEEARSVYLAAKNPELSELEIKRWVSATDGFSIAHLKELIVSVECFEVDFDESIERLRTMMGCKISSTDLDNSIGFGS